MQGTVLSVGYVGSHGVNLITGQEQNPVPYTIDSNGVYHFAATTVGSQLLNKCGPPPSRADDSE